MAKKYDRTVWHGVDDSKEISLFEYGLLVRFSVKDNSWQIVYKNPYQSGVYSVSWADESVIEDVFGSDGWGRNDLTSFCSTIGETWAEWKKKPFYLQLNDLFSHFGAQEFTGCDYSGGMSAKEACKFVRIRYEEEYEMAS